MARTNKLLKQYESSLNDKDMSTFRIRRSEPEDRMAPGIRLATMHRVKGLEFDRVIIAGVNAGIVPYEGLGTDSSDPMVKIESEISYFICVTLSTDIIFHNPFLFISYSSPSFWCH